MEGKDALRWSRPGELIGVSREGFDEQGKGLDAALVPDDLLEAWKR